MEVPARRKVEDRRKVWTVTANMRKSATERRIAPVSVSAMIIIVDLFFQKQRLAGCGVVFFESES